MCPRTLLQGSSLCVSALKLYLTRASPSRVTDCVAGWAGGRGEICWAWGWAKVVGCWCCCGCDCGCITLTWTRGGCFWEGGGGGGSSSSSSSSAGRIWTKRRVEVRSVVLLRYSYGVLGRNNNKSERRDSPVVRACLPPLSPRFDVGPVPYVVCC